MRNVHTYTHIHTSRRWVTAREAAEVGKCQGSRCVMCGFLTGRGGVEVGTYLPKYIHTYISRHLPPMHTCMHANSQKERSRRAPGRQKSSEEGTGTGRKDVQRKEWMRGRGLKRWHRTCVMLHVGLEGHAIDGGKPLDES